MSVVLACDLGGSSLRAALISAEGEILASHHIVSAVALSRSGFSEADPEHWWRDIRLCVDALHAAAPEAFSAVQGIGLCGFTRTQVAIGHDGCVLRPAITWQDTRGDVCLAALRRILPPSHPETAQINAFHPLARLQWLHEHEPRILDQLATILDPKDFITFRLTGRRCSDPISLARLLAASQPDHDGRNLFNAAGLPDHILPQLLPPTAELGQVKSNLDGALDKLAGKPVFNGSNDTWAAVLGLGAMRTGLAYNISGTTEVFGVMHETAASAEGLLSVNWGGLHQLGGPGQNGADTMRWLHELLEGCDPDREIGSWLSPILTKTRDPQPLLFLPYLNGERTPYWNPALRGAFIGLNRRHAATDLAYAVLEGIGFHNRIILERAETATGVTIEEIRFGGGASVNALWCQIKADICQRPVVVGKVKEPGLLGTAAVIWTGLGHYPSLDKAQQAMVKTSASYAPDASRSTAYDKLFAQFKIAEQALVPVSTALADMPFVAPLVSGE